MDKHWIGVSVLVYVVNSSTELIHARLEEILRFKLDNYFFSVLVLVDFFFFKYLY